MTATYQQMNAVIINPPTAMSHDLLTTPKIIKIY